MKKKHIKISNKLLGTLIIIGLIIELVLPLIHINIDRKIAYLLYLIVTIYLIINN